MKTEETSEDKLERIWRDLTVRKRSQMMVRLRISARKPGSRFDLKKTMRTRSFKSLPVQVKALIQFHLDGDTVSRRVKKKDMRLIAELSRGPVIDDDQCGDGWD